MGLDISSRYSDKEYSHGYGGLHRIRVLGMIAAGGLTLFSKQDVDDYLNGLIFQESEFDRKNKMDISFLKHLRRDSISKPIDDVKIEMLYKLECSPWHNKIGYEHFPQIYQLLHFSDCEGVFIPEIYLEGIDYKQSYYLGNLTELAREMEFIHNELGKLGKLPSKEQDSTYWDFYELVIDESENNGMLTFH